MMLTDVSILLNKTNQSKAANLYIYSIQFMYCSAYTNIIIKFKRNAVIVEPI